MLEAKCALWIDVDVAPYFNNDGMVIGINLSVPFGCQIPVKTLVMNIAMDTSRSFHLNIACNQL